MTTGEYVAVRLAGAFLIASQGIAYCCYIFFHRHAPHSAVLGELILAAGLLGVATVAAIGRELCV